MKFKKSSSTGQAWKLHGGMVRLVMTLLFVAVSGTAWALDPGLPPGSNFDLSHWYLQLPTSNNILTGASGSVDSASTAQLAAGFTNAYFETGPDGAMVFWAPDDGARTDGSTHPRSELREELAPGDTSVNWIPFGTHILTATCVVSNVPSDTEKVCIGQIHENAGGGVPMAMIMYTTTTAGVYVNYWPDGDSNSSESWSYGSHALGSLINYQFAVVNGVLSVAINGVTNSLNLFASGASWTETTNAVYFKAGAYSQSTNACGCSTDGARVAFYSLTHYHAPSITNQPVSLVVNAGGNAAFSVGASGNGALSYQWWFDGTNLLNGASNASLTLAGVSGANGGNYTVVVSDNTSSFSSVTSSVATLAISGPAIIAGVLVTNQAWQMSYTGAPLGTYWVQAKTNLTQPNWLNIATNTAGSNGVCIFTDTGFTNHPSRFYRVATP